jgi:tripartite-type tricarboxylate transporter receptor subunit TctC
MTLLVGFPPGGITDNLARLMARKLSERLGQPIVIDNRAGAGGSLAAEVALRAPADGYTLLIGTQGMFGANLVLYKNLKYDPLKDFTAVHSVFGSANILVANPSRPFKDVKELVAYAKANPGKLNYGSAGVGTATHLTAVLFQQITGTQMTHVPYKGSAPALTDLVGGAIDIMFDFPNTTEPFVKAGKLNALAVMHSDRVATLPNVPTIAQAGVQGAEALAWSGLFVPSKTPPAIVARLSAELDQVMADPEYVAGVAQQGAIALNLGHAKFQDFVNVESPRWRETAQKSGATAE